ncbi:hypothetical protein BY998_12260 [Methylobacterium sp. B4]|nr:hypothetical protein BY998_12260 [Methylobacterium sp. B4]
MVREAGRCLAATGTVNVPVTIHIAAIAMPDPLNRLADEASARLPLFDDLPAGTVDRLAALGFGRGLLTAAIRARLRKAGFADMGALALATPADLMMVRKIGPVRVEAIRAHLLGELARLVPGARAAHDRDATDRRRLDRLRAVPVEPALLGRALVERFGPAGATWADLASLPRAQALRALGISAADLEDFVSALARALQPDRPGPLPAGTTREDDAREAMAEPDRAEIQRERDREWDEAAPARCPGPGRTD